MIIWFGGLIIIEKIFFLKHITIKKLIFGKKKLIWRKKIFTLVVGGLTKKKLMVVYALRWQLKLNKKNSKNYDWIAVVKRNNVAVKKLTNFLGYKNVSKNNSHYEIIKNTFNVSHKKYYYLHLNNNQ